MQVSMEIPIEAESVALARDVVVEAMAGASTPRDRIEDLRLLTSEIVTNALRHGGSRTADSIGLAVDVSLDRIRVEVADRGPGFEPTVLEGPNAGWVGGWGLFLVDRLADAWGVIRGERNSVWFELHL